MEFYDTICLEMSTTRKIRVVQKEGERKVSREIDFYNLDSIIAVGYHVNSKQATQFRMIQDQNYSSDFDKELNKLK